MGSGLDLGKEVVGEGVGVFGFEGVDFCVLDEEGGGGGGFGW